MSSNIKFKPHAVWVVAILASLLFTCWYGGIFTVSKKVSLKNLLLASIKLTEEAGKRVKEIRESSNLNIQSKGETKEGKKELVTLGDKESNQIIMSGLGNFFPNLKVISEEREIVKKDSHFTLGPFADLNSVISDDVLVANEDVAVWVDPLDATQEYSENLKQYVTIMICVAVRGEPTIGIIHKPFFGKTYWGWVDHGRSRNLPKSVQPHTGTFDTLIVSRSHAGVVEKVAHDAFKEVKVVRAGGAGYKTLEVIYANATAYVHVTKIKKWDICAGHALLRTYAEGTLTDLRGNPVSYSASLPVALDTGLIATGSQHDYYVRNLRSFAEAAEHHNRN